MEEQLEALLTADAGMQAALTTVFWGWRSQGSAPVTSDDPNVSVTLNLTDGPDDETNDGPSGFVDAHVQADVWGATFTACMIAARALRAALATANVATTNGVIQAAFVEHEHTTIEGEAPNRIFRRRLDLCVPYAA